MKQTAIFPGRYVQSEGALADLGDEVSRLGTRVLLIAGGTAQGFAYLRGFAELDGENSAIGRTVRRRVQ